MAAFSYLTVASPLHDAATVDRVTTGIRAALDEAGGTRVSAPQDHPERPLVILVATGGTEAAVLGLVASRQAVAPAEPVLLAAHPLHNSLPAALEAMARLHADGHHGRIVQVQGGDVGALVDAVQDVAAVRRLQATRLGLVGQPSDWLVASVPDAARLRARWGVELVPIDIGVSIEAHRHAEPAAVQSVAVRFAGRGMPDPELAKAAALHPALVASIDAAQVDAVTVRCFDYLTELSTSGCVALATLNDTGIVAGCEGDVASAVAMLWVRALLDQPSWMANPASVDPEGNRLLLAHCTVAPSLVEEVELHTHFESGLGIGLRGRFAPGWVTLVRLGGPALERCWIAEAELEHAGGSEDLCRTQVTLRLEGTPVDSLLEAPLGNHLVMFPGRHRARLERWWRLAFGEDLRGR
jgi:L-fucose isomerase-like protein